MNERLAKTTRRQIRRALGTQAESVLTEQDQTLKTLGFTVAALHDHVNGPLTRQLTDLESRVAHLTSSVGAVEHVQGRLAASWRARLQFLWDGTLPDA